MPPTDAASSEIDQLAHEHHVDREALVVQLRALGDAISHLAEAVESAAGGEGADPTDPAVAAHLDEARWALKAIW